MSRTLRNLLLLLPIAWVAACGACVYETRFVGTEGQRTTSAGTLRVLYVNMREYRDGGPISNFITWNIQAENLTSPPVALVLLTSAGQVSTPLTMSSSSSQSMTASGSIDTSPGDARFVSLNAGDGTVRLQLEDGSTIELALVVQVREDWHHPECS